MRHAVIVALLAVLTSSMSLSAEARRHHHHRHHYPHYRHIHHHRYYSLVSARHRSVHHPARHWLAHRHAHFDHQQHSGITLPQPATAPARLPHAAASALPPAMKSPAATANHPVKNAVPPNTPQNRTASIPAWNYPPETIKPVPGNPRHVLKPDTNSFVIIPGYRVDK